MGPGYLNICCCSTNAIALMVVLDGAAHGHRNVLLEMHMCLSRRQHDANHLQSGLHVLLSMDEVLWCCRCTWSPEPWSWRRPGTHCASTACHTWILRHWRACAPLVGLPLLLVDNSSGHAWQATASLLLTDACLPDTSGEGGGLAVQAALRRQGRVLTQLRSGVVNPIAPEMSTTAFVQTRGRDLIYSSLINKLKEPKGHHRFRKASATITS